MSSTPEITAQQLFDTINYKYKQNNSYFNYNEFAKQIEENDNKKIGLYFTIKYVVRREN